MAPISYLASSSLTAHAGLTRRALFPDCWTRGAKTLGTRVLWPWKLRWRYDCMPLWACSQYDVWHHRIWKPPFSPFHTILYKPSFSKISTLETVFENLWFWCPNCRLIAGRMAKTEKKYSFSKISGCACVRTKHNQPQRRRRRRRQRQRERPKKTTV